MKLFPQKIGKKNILKQFLTLFHHKYRQKILDEKNLMENIIGINDEKKRQLLAPARQSSTDLRNYMNEVADTEESERLVQSMQERKRMLLIPGENGTQPRIFIPVSA